MTRQECNEILGTLACVVVDLDDIANKATYQDASFFATQSFKISQILEEIKNYNKEVQS